MDEELENLIRYGQRWKPGEEPKVPDWQWRLTKIWLIILALATIDSCAYRCA